MIDSGRFLPNNKWIFGVINSPVAGVKQSSELYWIWRLLNSQILSITIYSGPNISMGNGMADPLAYA